MSNHVISEIYKSRTNILDILESRGFDTSDYNNFSYEELHSMIQNNQLDFIVKKRDSEKRVYVKYNIIKLLRPTNIYDYIEDLFHIENMLTKDDDLIIINKDEPNDTMHTTIKNIWLKESIYVSIINLARLQFNILNHTLVPKHIVLSSDEKTTFLEKYHITDETMIPTISYFSPVSIVLGIRPGDVCKIVRFSKTAIYSDFYRICVL
jgi:DNA-directed RNA polymerase I, II, and III subunit RPABC1